MDYPILAIGAGLAAAWAVATGVAAVLGRAGFPLPATPRNEAIDGLRGCLALSVLAHHFLIWMQVSHLGGNWELPPLLALAQLGTGAVGLFFMTTGFVFYPRILAGFRACPWRAILIGRVFRIIPLVAVSIAIVTAIIAARTGHGFDADYPKAAFRWLIASHEPPLLGDPDAGRVNSYVLWSLRYEWKFYLFVLPACALAMDLIRGRAPSWVVPVVLLAGGLAARNLSHRNIFPIVLPLFAIGMLAYECRRHERLARWMRKPAMTALALAALGLAMNTFIDPYYAAMPLFALFFTCVACGNDMGGLLRTRSMLVLGECSYGIYLLHGILLSLLFVDASALSGSLTAAQVPALLPLAALAAVLVAAAANLLIERPAIRLGRRIASRIARWGIARHGRTDGLGLGAAR